VFLNKSQFETVKQTACWTRLLGSDLTLKQASVTGFQKHKTPMTPPTNDRPILVLVVWSQLLTERFIGSLQLEAQRYAYKKK